MNNTIKELVKKHFNLVEATEQSFGEISTADGELTLSYEGDELAQGLAIFVVTPEGNIPAPDGEHMLEGDITIVTADGKIEAIKETEAPAEEELEEEIVSEEMAEEEVIEEEKMEEPVEAIADAVTEEVAEEVSDAVEAAIDEEVVAAVAEAVKEVVEEMTKEMEERMKSLEEKYASFSSAPASEKTIASSFSKKSKSEENYKNASAIEAMIARKTRKG